MPEKIIAVLEQRENKLKKASFEAVSVAAKIAADLNLESEVVVAGSEIENLNEAAKYGINKIVLLKNEHFKNYSPSGYADAISKYLKISEARYIIIPNTALGKDLAPRLSS